MGYEIQDVEPLNLPAFPGVEVVVKLATTFEEFKNMERISQAGMGPDMDLALKEFGDKFIDSWNLSSRGEEVPPNGEGFARLKLHMKLAILSSWLELMRGPSAPLGQESSNGLDSPDE